MEDLSSEQIDQPTLIFLYSFGVFMKGYICLILLLVISWSSFGGPIYAQDKKPQTNEITIPEEFKSVQDPFEEIKKESKEQDQDKFFYEFLNMLATLGLLVAALLGASWFVKRMMNTRVQQMNSSSLIKVTERRSLSPKTVIYLLEIQGKTLVVGETPAGLSKLGEFDFPMTPEERSEGDTKG